MTEEKDSILNLNDTSVTLFSNVTARDYLSTIPDQYMLAILDKGSVKSLRGRLHSGITTIYELIDHQNKKENLYLIALDNLIKKNDYLQLTIQLDQELVTDEEFQEELEKNEVKYLIKMNPDFDINDFKRVIEILTKLKRKFTNDDAAEIFSIPLENISSYIDSDMGKE